jgi:catechol 2,3-dioxygenase-like lactoylglutathione lyase family enzyme
MLIDTVRRTTITTYDIAESLRYYVDTLGMEIWFDTTLVDEVVCEIYDLPLNTPVRVVILRGEVENAQTERGPAVSGMVGLMEFVGLSAPDQSPAARRPVSGEMVLMFGTQHMLEIESRITSAGFHLAGPPIRLGVSGRNVVYELLGRDPNGVRIAFSQMSEIYL